MFEATKCNIVRSEQKNCIVPVDIAAVLFSSFPADTVPSAAWIFACVLVISHSQTTVAVPTKQKRKGSCAHTHNDHKYNQSFQSVVTYGAIFTAAAAVT